MHVDGEIRRIPRKGAVSIEILPRALEFVV
jgi:hypothetical protein